MHALCHCLNDTFSEGEALALRHLCTKAYEIVFPILLTTAVVTNGFNFFVLLYLHITSVKTSSRLYLMWLALTHTLACGPLIVPVYNLREATNISYHWAFYMAYIEQQLYNALNCASIYITLALALDRYAAVCNAFKYSGVKRVRKIKTRIVTVYIVSCLIYFPNCFAQEPKLISPAKGDLWYIGDSLMYHSIIWKIWAILVQSVHRLLPGIFLFFINMRIYSTVAKLQKRTTIGISLSSTRNSREKQLCYLLICFTIVFVIANVPSAVLEILYITHSQHCHLAWAEEVSRTVANYLEMSGFCFDFFLHFLVNKDYRRGIHKISSKVCKSGILCTNNSDNDDIITEL